MNKTLKRGCSDSSENSISKRKYNTRSKNKQQNEAPSISQSAKEKLDILALLRSRKINKIECSENKAKVFNKWSLLSSDEEIERKNNNITYNKSRSESLASSLSDNASSESDFSSSSASSCSYGKSKKLKKKFKKSKSRSSLSEESEDGQLKEPKKINLKEIKRKVTNSNTTDHSEVEDSKNKNSKNIISDIDSEINTNSKIDDSNEEKDRKKPINFKAKHEKNFANGEAFVLQTSSQINLTQKNLTSEESKTQKTDSLDPSAKKDKPKLTENNGPMHFTTHETVTADPHLTSNLSHEITKKKKVPTATLR